MISEEYFEDKYIDWCLENKNFIDRYFERRKGQWVYSLRSADIELVSEENIFEYEYPGIPTTDDWLRWMKQEVDMKLELSPQHSAGLAFFQLMENKNDATV